MNFSIYGTGLMMGLSLIVAIGSQNAFILRQGLRNEHVFAVCFACALSDAAWIEPGHEPGDLLQAGHAKHDQR
ncbi:hypothetical protein AB9F38_33930, partial [Rhizobium leguminosarum]